MAVEEAKVEEEVEVVAEVVADDIKSRLDKVMTLLESVIRENFELKK